MSEVAAENNVAVQVRSHIHLFARIVYTTQYVLRVFTRVHVVQINYTHMFHAHVVAFVFHRRFSHAWRSSTGRRVRAVIRSFCRQTAAVRAIAPAAHGDEARALPAVNRFLSVVSLPFHPHVACGYAHPFSRTAESNKKKIKTLWRVSAHPLPAYPSSRPPLLLYCRRLRRRCCPNAHALLDGRTKNLFAVFDFSARVCVRRCNGRRAQSFGRLAPHAHAQIPRSRAPRRRSRIDAARVGYSSCCGGLVGDVDRLLLYAMHHCASVLGRPLSRQNAILQLSSTDDR